MNLDAVICDFDDTLVESYAEFLAAEQEFLTALAALGVGGDGREVVEWLHAQDIANVEQRGYLAPDCFPRALHQTYVYFSRQCGLEPRAEIGAELERIGWRIFDRKPRIVEGAEDLLRWLQGRARLFLLTQGDPAIQQRRIGESGLAGYFRECVILRKKTPEAYRQVLADWRIDPARSWMLGDSLKSDIAPALQAGLNAAYLQMEGWAYELARPVEGSYSLITRLRDFKELIGHEDQGGGAAVRRPGA